MTERLKRNPLTIRLTESAVFLRSDGTFGRRNRGIEGRASMLRGLLVLNLMKPTRITSIELELLAKTTTAWPEGTDAFRLEVTEEHTIFHASTVYFRAAGKGHTRRNSSIGPGSALDIEETVFGDDLDIEHTPSYTPRNREEARDDYLRAPYETSGHERRSRRLSADSSFYQRIPFSHEEYTSPPTPPTPPYSPHDTHPSSPNDERTATSSAQTLEDIRNELNVGLLNGMSQSAGLSPSTSYAGSLQSYHTDLSLSPRRSIDDVPEDEPGYVMPGHRSRPGSRPSSRPPSRPPSPPNDVRGRRASRSRFSLPSVTSILKDVVRPSPPKTPHFADLPEHDGDQRRRGRTKEKATSVQSLPLTVARALSMDKTAISKLGDFLRPDHDESKAGDDWREFKKGTYTYPISFSIPANSPPTLRTNYGAVVWQLQATVHRPGAFKPKLSASREVIVITCPTEEDTEDTENIIVERHWENQLQYLISVSGRSFYVGGTVPVTFTLMPLAKVKIHRLSVYIEERIDYYTHMKRIVRTDPLRRIDLLMVKEQGKENHYILPLDSDDVDAFRESPLFALMGPDDDLSEMASSLMGPGPWTFHQDLPLPASCDMMHMTNRNRRSNIIVTHQLKCVIRVERGDDLLLDSKTGKRKLFDIVVQTPIHILSCRCNPEWSSLPCYSESFDDVSTVVPKCPCDVRRAEEARTRKPSALERMTSRHSTDSGASPVESSPVNPATMPSLRQRDTLYSQNTQFERLISGQESEIGEAPPTYTASVSMVSTQSH